MTGNNLTTSVEYVNFIMSLAKQLEIDTEEICTEVGFDCSALDYTGERLPYEKFIKIWNALEDKSSDENLGLHLGEKAFSFPGHILFILILNSPTIKEAIEKFCQYFNLLNEIHTPIFLMENDVASLSIHFHTDNFRSSRHIYESLLAVYACVLGRVSNDQIVLDAVYFSHKAPDDVSEHRRIFSAPLLFEQQQNKLVFNSKYLDMKVQFSNVELLETLERLAKKLQEKLYSYGSWSDKVSEIMVRMLQGTGSAIEHIAKELALSPRSLQVKLKKEGVTYQKLLDNVRREQAVYFLKHTNVAISEITLLLGYSEQSVFTRAFKRWTGSNPGQFRTETNSGSAK